jgi:outer membrane protein
MKFLLLFLVSTSAFSSVSLRDAFQAARLNMESIKRADASVNQREEQKIRARAAVLPNLSAVGTFTRIDQPQTASGASPFTLIRQYSDALRVTQPLLRGGTMSAYQMAKDNLLLSEFQKNATEVSLYQLVINSYYNLIISLNDNKNLEELKRLSANRVRELKDRAGIGRSRIGELRDAEAQLLTADSQAMQGVINLQQAERTFEFYTRLTPTNLDPLSDIPMVSDTLAVYLDKIKNRPDIQASNQLIRVAESQVDIAKGSHYPSVDFTANYYLARTGILATSKWDMGVAVIIPIYQGGGVQASVREAVEGRRIAQLTTSETTRAAERDLAVLYQNYVQIITQLKTLQQAMKVSEEAYKLNQKDYQYGLVPNLTVIQSLNNFISSKRSYDSLYAMAHMTYKSLEASIGVLP